MKFKKNKSHFTPNNTIRSIKKGIKKELIFNIHFILEEKTAKDKKEIIIAPRKIGTLNSCEKNAPKPATIITKEINKKTVIILLIVKFKSLLFPTKNLINSKFVFILLSEIILKDIYIILPIKKLENIKPSNPKKPYEQKNTYISFPEANPAPIIVPIITKLIFKVFLI